MEERRQKTHGSRQVQKEATRKRLIDKALRLFGDQGILNTSTADVANSASVSHGTVFAHFPTRDDLVAEAISEFAGNVARKIHKLASRDASLREVLQAHLDSLSTNEAFYSRLVLEGPLLPAYARSTLIGIQSAISFHLNSVAEREMAAGRIRRIPIHLLFNGWIGIVHHYVSNRDLFSPKGSVLKKHGATLVQHYLDLLSTT